MQELLNTQMETSTGEKIESFQKGDVVSFPTGGLCAWRKGQQIIFRKPDEKCETASTGSGFIEIKNAKDVLEKHLKEIGFVLEDSGNGKFLII